MRTRSSKSTRSSQCSSRDSARDVDESKRLPLEVMCRILRYLNLADVCKMNMMCKAWLSAVKLFLRYTPQLSFRDPDDVTGSYASSMTPLQLKAIFCKCRMLKHIKGFFVEYPHPGGRLHVHVIDTLESLPHLQTIELSDLKFISELKGRIPQLQVPVFRNRSGLPLSDISTSFETLFANMSVREIELCGVTVPSLPQKLCLVQSLHLQDVTFKRGMTTESRRFLMPNLESFMMHNCTWPAASLEQTHTTLFIGLAACRHLEVLHLVGTALDGMIFRRIIASNWVRVQPFSCLKRLVLDVNWGLHENSIGALLIASSLTLETLYLQKSLSRDMTFQALETCGVTFPSLKSVKFGYVDELNPPLSDGVSLTEYNDELPAGRWRPCQLSDYGLKMASETLTGPQLTSLSINDCSYLNNPLAWITDSKKSCWKQLESFSLSQCPTTNLDQLNKLLVKLVSLKILNLVGMFPQPPKGCSRVGLSAGMNITGAIGIRAIISQPPAAAPLSLLSVSDVDVKEMQSLMRMGCLPESDNEDTTEPADPTQGYRSTQVHAGCTTNSPRIRRSRVRVKAHEKVIQGGCKGSLNTHQRKCSASLRRSSRKRNTRSAMSLNEEPDAELVVSISRQLGTTSPRRDGNFSRDETMHERMASGCYGNRANKLTALSEGKAAKRQHDSDSDDISPEPKHSRCQACLGSLEQPNPEPLPSTLQLHWGPNHSNSRTRDFRTCLKCVKRQCREARKHARTPSISSIKPGRGPMNTDKHLIFDASTGYSRLCTSAGSHWKVKGKQPARITRSSQDASKSTVKCWTASSTASSQASPVQLKGKKPLKASSKVKVNEAASQERATKRGQVRHEKAKVHLRSVADKETHTKDPFIEDDAPQILYMEHIQNNITNINVSNCGLTELRLSAARHLVAVTAFACPVLKQISFATEPWSSPRIVRITQCPKMSLPRLLNSLSMQNACEGDEKSSHVKTVEFEPMTQYDREETLIELARLPQVNKVLVECQGSTGGDQCTKLKAFYENLLKDMSGSGRAPYRPDMEFKIYFDEIGGKKLIVSHNIPSCSVKLMSHCCRPDCEVTSYEGHQLHGCTAFCFVYPVHAKKMNSCD